MITVEEDSVIDDVPEESSEKFEVEHGPEAEPISGDEIGDSEHEPELREELMEVETVDGGEKVATEVDVAKTLPQNVESLEQDAADQEQKVQSPGKNVEREEMVDVEEQPGEEIMEGDVLEEVDTVDAGQEAEVIVELVGWLLRGLVNVMICCCCCCGLVADREKVDISYCISRQGDET